MCWLYGSEVNSLRMRNKGAAVQCTCNWSTNFMTVMVTPVGFAQIGWYALISSYDGSSNWPCIYSGNFTLCGWLSHWHPCRFCISAIQKRYIWSCFYIFSAISNIHSSIGRSHSRADGSILLQISAMEHQKCCSRVCHKRWLQPYQRGKASSSGGGTCVEEEDKLFTLQCRHKCDWISLNFYIFHGA